MSAIFLSPRTGNRANDLGEFFAEISVIEHNGQVSTNEGRSRAA
jgi:hypothetical protein